MEQSADPNVMEVTTSICTRKSVGILLKLRYVNIPLYEKFSHSTLTTMRQWRSCRNRKDDNRKRFGTCIELFDSSIPARSVNNRPHFIKNSQFVFFRSFTATPSLGAGVPKITPVKLSRAWLQDALCNWYCCDKSNYSCNCTDGIVVWS